MKPETLPFPDTRIVSMYEIFREASHFFMTAPRDQYDMKAHAKLARVRKAAYEASYWLESGTRRAQ